MVVCTNNNGNLGEYPSLVRGVRKGTSELSLSLDLRDEHLLDIPGKKNLVLIGL